MNEIEATFRKKILDHIGLLEKMQKAGGINNKPTQNLLKACFEYVNISEIALQKLARLGNGKICGNSDGNIIAQEALSKLGKIKP